MLNNKELLGQYLIEGREQKGWNHSAQKAFFVFFQYAFQLHDLKSHMGQQAKFMAHSRQQSKQKLVENADNVRFPLWNKGDLEVDLSKLLTPGEYTDIMSKGKQTKNNL